MRSRGFVVVAGLVALALVAAPGCVSKKLFRKNVEDSDTRVAAVESGVEANERRIGDLKQETDSRIAELGSKAEKAVEVGRTAMSRADDATRTAEQAARGRLLWEVTLTNDQVKFSFNQAAIPSDAAAVLDDLVGRVRSYNKAVYVEIEGHTDATGSDDYNYLLGQKRAEAVRNYMARGGIPLHAMNVISLGESSPIADNNSPAGRSKNRRVVVKVLE